MEISNCDKKFVTSLFVGLNSRGINYAISGDYEGLPEEVGHDIDVWTNDLKGFREVLLDTINLTGYKVLIDNLTANGSNVAFYKRDGDMLTFMKIDVLVDTSYKSVLTLVDKDIIRNNVAPYKDFFVMSPESEAIGHFLYPLFEWGYIKKEQYKSDIKKYCHSELFSNTFVMLWGNKTANHLLKLIDENKWEDIYRQISSLKRKALLRCLLKLSTWKKILLTIYYTLYRIIKPSGKCLAFCGLDGAGKTTILDELNKLFVELLKSKKVYYGYWRPFVIPEIRVLFGKENSKAHIDTQVQKGVTIKKTGKKTRSKIISLFKLIYYCIDYILAPIKYGGIRSRGGMVLFDRHYVDMAVHPQRFEMELPRWIILLFYKFIPKADYTFFMYCTPEEILQRKQEFSNDEIKQQIKDYNMIGKRIKRFIPIHTNTTIAEEIDEILSHIAI